jgi:hypothetical protein
VTFTDYWQARGIIFHPPPSPGGDMADRLAPFPRATADAAANNGSCAMFVLENTTFDR